MFLRHLLSRYDTLLTTAPIRVKAITSCCISATGDTLVQWSTRGEDGAGFDRERTARQAFWSFSLAPFVHWQYGVLARVQAAGA